MDYAHLVRYTTRGQSYVLYITKVHQNSLCVGWIHIPSDSGIQNASGRGDDDGQAQPRSLLHHSQPDQECSIFQRQEVVYLSGIDQGTKPGSIDRVEEPPSVKLPLFQQSCELS